MRAWAAGEEERNKPLLLLLFSEKCKAHQPPTKIARTNLNKAELESLLQQQQPSADDHYSNVFLLSLANFEWYDWRVWQEITVLVIFLPERLEFCFNRRELVILFVRRRWKRKKDRRGRLECRHRCPRTFFLIFNIPLLTKEKILNLHTHASSGAVWWSKAKENRWNLKFKSPARAFSSGRRWQRRERESQTSGAQVYPSDSLFFLKEKILEERKGEIFSRWLLLITQTHSVRLLWDGWEGSFPFLFFARAFWRAAAGVKAGPAASSDDLVISNSGSLQQCVFFSSSWHWPVDSPAGPRFSMDSQFLLNCKIHNSGQCGRESRDFLFYSDARDVIPFPRFQKDFSFPNNFVSFFWNFVFPAQLMTT